MNENHSAEQVAPVCWRSECRNGCYYPHVCTNGDMPFMRVQSTADVKSEPVGIPRQTLADWRAQAFDPNDETGIDSWIARCVDLMDALEGGHR